MKLSLLLPLAFTLACNAPLESAESAPLAPDSALPSACIDEPPLLEDDAGMKENTVRWGDATTVTVHAALGSITNAVTNQLVNARRPGCPTTWTVLLFANLVNVNPSGPAFRYTVNYTIVIGTGASQVTLTYSILVDSAFTPATAGFNVQGPFELVTNNPQAYVELQFPAENIQVNAAVVNTFQQPGPDETIQVGAFVSPRYNQPESDAAASDEQAKSPITQEHWMGPGFEGVPVQYRR